MTLRNRPGGDEVPKLERSHLRGVGWLQAGPSFQRRPPSQALGSGFGRRRFASHSGPPSSDKGNLERKGKIVKRGAKGHKGKKKKPPPLNKNEDQDHC